MSESRELSEKKPKVGKPKESAAGAAAVASSLNHVMRKAGLVRGTKALLDLNQKDGFDCPSCAWPDPDDERASAEFCENGAKAMASEATSRMVDAEFFRAHSVESLKEESDYWHDQQGRLTEPMVYRREEGATHYEPISWEGAFELVAESLKGLDDPNEALFYTSGRASNEAAFLYQLFVRSFGTNNLPDCSNMCHESSGAAMMASVGVGKGTVSLDDLDEAEVILCIGQNPGTNHPRMLSSLEQCVENGGKVVAVNPLKEAGLMGFAHPQKISGMLGKATPLASQYVQVKVNGDFALMRAIGKYFFEKEAVEGGVLDADFVAEHTRGVDDYKACCEAEDWDDLVERSGVVKEEILKLAETMLAGERKLITCWAMGLTQHRNAVATIREVCNVHLLMGALGRPGAGLCPVRGHSNVQGDRTVGIFEKMPESFLARMDEVFGMSCPRAHGFDVVDSILAMNEGRGKVLVCLGGNFLQAAPDTNFVADALEKTELTVQISTKLNRSHLMTGMVGLILPCLGRSEVDEQGGRAQFVSCENSMGIVQKSQGKLRPAGEQLKSEVAIVAGMAEATVGNTEEVRWSGLAKDYDLIRVRIEQVVSGFKNYNGRVRNPGGFYLPNAVKERSWETPSGKAEFSDAALEQFEVGDGRLILQTLRSHDQYNTTVYGLNDRYRGIGMGRRIIFLNPDDMKERGIQPVSLVNVRSFWDEEIREAHDFYAIPYEMPRGTAAGYFPEMNVLVPVGSTAIESHTPTSKSVEIEVEAV